MLRQTLIGQEMRFNGTPDVVSRVVDFVLVGLRLRLEVERIRLPSQSQEDQDFRFVHVGARQAVGPASPIGSVP
jgi:hypothetical protein